MNRLPLGGGGSHGAEARGLYSPLERIDRALVHQPVLGYFQNLPK